MLESKDIPILFVVDKTILRSPLGIMYLSGLLKKHGYKTETVDADYKLIRGRLRKCKFDIICFSVSTVGYENYLNIARTIKQEFSILMLWGGIHPTFFPEIIEDDSIDGVCIGEGEFALLELVKAYRSGTSIANMQNWWIKEKGKIYRNNIRPLVEDLDKLPFADRELFSDFFPFDQRSQAFITSRGCPYSCSYCFNEPYYNLYRNKGKRVRRRSVENIIAEIKEVKNKYSINRVFFYDDIFILSKPWLREFSSRYRKKIGIPFFCNVRAELVDGEMMHLLKRAGCIIVGMAIETANDHIRTDMLNRHVSKEQLIVASEIIKAHGIRLITYNMFGLPQSSIDNEISTLKLNRSCSSDFVDISFYQPYPYTRLGKKTIENGEFKSNFGEYLDKKRGFFVRYSLSIGNKHKRRQIENLHYLSDILVKFPLFLLIAKFLIMLPLNKLYFFLYKVWTGYVRYHRLYSRKMGSLDYLKMLTFYLRKP